MPEAPPTEDATLAERGDRPARGVQPSSMEALYDRHATDVRRVLGALGLRGPALDDGLQETFLRLLADQRRAKGGYDPGRPLRPWLLGIARHVAVDVLRKVRPTAEVEAERGPAVDQPPSAAEERREMQGVVARALDALPPDVAHALTLRHVAGLTMEELAQALGCSVPTARSRLVAGATLLAADLRRRGVGPVGGRS